MNWLLRHLDPQPAPRPPHARPMAVGDPDIDAFLAAAVFACTTCGRTDLSEAGDWDPPICEECDAAINFDQIQEAMDEEDAEDDAF
jgi:hypothetical protein